VVECRRPLVNGIIILAVCCCCCLVALIVAEIDQLSHASMNTHTHARTHARAALSITLYYLLNGFLHVQLTRRLQ